METQITIHHFVQHHFNQQHTRQIEEIDLYTQKIDNHFPGIAVSKFDFYTILLGIKGKATLGAAHHVFELNQHSISILPPDTICKMEHLTDDFEAYIVVFTPDFLKKGAITAEIIDELLYINQEYAPVFEVEPLLFTSLYYKFTGIEKEAGKESPFYLEMIRLYLLQILYDYNRVCEICLLNSQKNINRPYQIVYEFRKLVDLKFRELKTVKEYADLLFITPKYLSQCVKEQTGGSAIHIIHKRIVLEAELLLNYSASSIKEIADLLRFDSASHFSRFFKNIKAQSPGQYRNKR